MDVVITVEHLQKVYKRQQRKSGLHSVIKDFFRRKYTEIKALKDINFTVREGEIVGYIGPNGAGKTTTLKILSGILYPSGGFVNVLGFTPWKRKGDFLKRITLIMGQKNQLWWDLPAMDSFLLFKEIYEVPDDIFKKQISTLLDMLDAGKLVNYPVRYLSMGERMKMEIVGALIHDPDIIFLDEPTIGLDVLSQTAIREFLSTYNKEFQKTVILTSHYMKDIEELSNRVIFIMNGEIIYDGAIDKLISKTLSYEYVEVTFDTSKGFVKKSYKVNKEEIPNFLRKLLSDNSSIVEIKHKKPDLEEVARIIMASNGIKKDE